MNGCVKWYLNYMTGCRRFEKRIAKILSFKTIRLVV